MSNDKYASYFVQAKDKQNVNGNVKYDDATLAQLTEEMKSTNQQKNIKIGVVYLGRSAPGGNNVVDGLLRYQNNRKNVELIGFVNG